MKRILLALFFGYVFGAVVFGQQQGGVAFQPIMNFDSFFEGVTEWFTDVLKDVLLLFSSLLFVWFSYRYIKKILDDRSEESMTEEENREMMTQRSDAEHMATPRPEGVRGPFSDDEREREETSW